MSFSKLGLSDQLLQAIKYENYERPYPIQTRTIPAILNGKDVVGFAPTGSGKTIAFGIPMVARVQRLEHGAVRALQHELGRAVRGLQQGDGLARPVGGPLGLRRRFPCLRG